MALALELFRSAPRYLAARAVGTKAPGLVAGPLAPLRLANRSDPQPRDDRWTRVKPALAGICGSDLSTLAGKSSFYFSPLVSLPFVPGHEVVGEVLDDVDGLSAGDRVVLSSVLNCATRGLDPCPNCRMRRVQPMRCGDDRRSEGRTPDRVLHGYRWRVEPDDARASLATASGPRR